MIETIAWAHNKERFGGHREEAIARDGMKCVECGISRDDHKSKYGRDITVDHIDGNGRHSKEKNHRLENLQTLCLTCHSSKDSKAGKMTWRKVTLMRELYQSGQFTKKQLRLVFGMSNICQIISNKQWKTQ